ncbi:MAG: ATP-binding cassette domain-containing protein [Faecalibacillus sp.]
MLKINHLTKRYDHLILDDISLEFPSHGLVVIVGNSGCGKSTLLHILAGLDQDYEGEIFVEGKNIREIKYYIRRYIGFVFQNMYLINEMNIKDNYLLSSYFKKIFPSQIKKYIDQLNLSDLHFPKASLLSLGQKQRVAILRTLVNDSSIILCDEPTGSLDQKNSENVFSLLQQIAKEKLVIVVSHDNILSKQYCHYLYKLDKGKMYFIKKDDCKKQIVKQKKRHKSFLFLLVKLLRISFKKYVLFIQIIFISIFSILFTFSLTDSTQKEIHQQLEQIIPSTTIMAKRKDNQDISSINQFHKEYILYHCVEYDDIELLGLSKDNTLDANKTLYISDYTQNCSYSLKKGRMFQEDNEIILSLSTYEHLCQLYQQKNMLNKTIYLFIQYRQHISSIPVIIAGIVNHKTVVETIYLKEDAYMHYCQQLFQMKGAQMFFLQVRDKQNIEQLKKDYPQYRFQIANTYMVTSIDEKMKQLEGIMFCFCILAIISSCFLLGEVIYLHVVKNKKMFSIFKALGASSFQITIAVLSQALFMSMMGYFQAVILLKCLISVINDILQNYFVSSSKSFFVVEGYLLLVVFVLCLMLTLICCYIPIQKAHKIDIIQGIKA